MAYTQIHAIKTTVNKAIDYICDPEKTAEKFLISSFACAPETAAFDFKYTLDHCRESSINQAYHLIQSFVPGEVSYEEAHRIGIELADKVLEGKYAYIVTTHIDKEHIHNHILFCAADHINYDKYHDCKQTYYRIRNLSDELCKEHHLSVIEPEYKEKRGQKYIEWQAEKTDTSWKSKIRKDINTAIKSSATYEEFLQILKAKGYEIKGESLEDGCAKYISFRPADKERFVRGSAKSLGKEYSKERIKERIDSGLERNFKVLPKDRISKGLIDMNQEKIKGSIRLKQWASVENLKNIAESYGNAGSIMELEQKLSNISSECKTAKNNLLQTEKRMKSLMEIIKYAEQYQYTLPYYTAYKKAKNPDNYFRKHESEIILHGGAKHMLEQYRVLPKSLNLQKLKMEFSELESRKKALYADYKTLAKSEKETCKQLNKLKVYLDENREHNTFKKKKDQHLL